MFETFFIGLFVFVVTFIVGVVLIIAAGVIWAAYFGETIIDEDFADITDNHKGGRL